MSEQAIKAAAANSQSTQDSQNTHDEIDQILNEVEVLRKELDASGPSFFNTPETPELESAPPATTLVVATPVSTPAPVATPVATTALGGPSLEEIMDSNSQSGVLSAAAQAEVREVAEAADELMKEFHSALEQGNENSDESGSTDNPGMEDTLAGLKPDTSVKTLLDDVEADEQSSDSPAAEIPEFDRATYTESNVIALHDKVVASQHRPQAATIPSAVTPSGAPATSAEPGCLKMTLSGNMTLKLQYEFAGQEVMISFIDDCLKVETHGGAEFKIPFGSASASKKKSSQAV